MVVASESDESRRLRLPAAGLAPHLTAAGRPIPRRAAISGFPPDRSKPGDRHDLVGIAFQKSIVAILAILATFTRQGKRGPELLILRSTDEQAIETIGDVAVMRVDSGQRRGNLATGADWRLFSTASISPRLLRSRYWNQAIVLKMIAVKANPAGQRGPMPAQVRECSLPPWRSLDRLVPKESAQVVGELGRGRIAVAGSLGQGGPADRFEIARQVGTNSSGRQRGRIVQEPAQDLSLARTGVRHRSA